MHTNSLKTAEGYIKQSSSRKLTSSLPKFIRKSWIEAISLAAIFGAVYIASKPLAKSIASMSDEADFARVVVMLNTALVLCIAISACHLLCSGLFATPDENTAALPITKRQWYRPQFIYLSCLFAVLSTGVLTSSSLALIGITREYQYLSKIALIALLLIAFFSLLSPIITVMAKSHQSNLLVSIQQLGPILLLAGFGYLVFKTDLWLHITEKELNRPTLTLTLALLVLVVATAAFCKWFLARLTLETLTSAKLKSQGTKHKRAALAFGGSLFGYNLKLALRPRAHFLPAFVTAMVFVLLALAARNTSQSSIIELLTSFSTTALILGLSSMSLNTAQN